jgi:hypothetical protein
VNEILIVVVLKRKPNEEVKRITQHDAFLKERNMSINKMYFRELMNLLWSLTSCSGVQTLGDHSSHLPISCSNSLGRPHGTSKTDGMYGFQEIPCYTSNILRAF